MPIEAYWVIAAAFLAVAAGMGPLISLMKRLGVLDHPNERSSHVNPTPLCGGVLVVPVLLASWLALADRPMMHVAFIAMGLYLLSFIDDVRHIPASIRFPLHVVAVAAALYFEPTFAFSLFQFVPEPVAYFAVGFVWVWFINLYNFMDGMDGITGVETLSIGVGIAAVILLYGYPSDLASMGLAAAAVAVGFLLWNWHPAKVFLGDVGAVPLGFLLGWLLLTLAAIGPWIVAMILPAYYLADSTLTLLRRFFAGAKIWHPHREHFFQKALAGGGTHHQVALYVLGCNLVLVAVSLLYRDLGPFLTWLLAAVPVAFFLRFLASYGSRSSRPD